MRDDIIKEKDVRTAPSHIVIVYRCPACTRVDRIVAERSIWLEYIEDKDFEDYVIDREVDAFADDMDVLVDDVGDLLNIWASLQSPPPIESMRKCACASCQHRRFYNAGQ